MTETTYSIGSHEVTEKEFYSFEAWAYDKINDDWSEDNLNRLFREWKKEGLKE